MPVLVPPRDAGEEIRASPRCACCCPDSSLGRSTLVSAASALILPLPDSLLTFSARLDLHLFIPLQSLARDSVSLGNRRRRSRQGRHVRPANTKLKVGDRTGEPLQRRQELAWPGRNEPIEASIGCACWPILGYLQSANSELLLHGALVCGG